MAREIKQIAIYGKGGIGKSTTSSNISAALSKLGYKVMQVGCDPKSDSTNTLREGKYIPTVLDTLRAKGKTIPEEIVFKGFNGVYCVEAGGPAPGVGCAGRGIITAVEQLKQLKVFENLGIDVVIYDVLGDVVCGGFAVPIREGIAKHVFTVTSSDFMAIYAANNLFAGIQKYSASGGALLGGMIANSINAPYSRSIVDDFASRTRTRVVEYIPRSVTVTQAELRGKTVIETQPDSAQGKIYLRLAQRLADHAESRTPAPMSVPNLHEWATGWATELLKVETGEVGQEAQGI
ncbi:MAG: AAA family ATPase [Planctomycetota bacterium]|jgi:nitrogenase iron protein NifH|nr:AAA family ATPase [Planctomycetota bacterium]